MNLPTAHSAAATTRTVSLFIVGKSWFDGPRFEASKDLPLLFANRALADNVASQSAHAYARQEPVRTIPLKSNGEEVEYAFSTRGKLFWVRRVNALVIKQLPTGQSFSNASTQAHALADLQAYCIINYQVIGGTGNPNSRRGSEHREGCVVLARVDSSSLAVSHLQKQASSESEIQVVPIVSGQPALDGIQDPYSLLRAWSDAHEWVPPPLQQHNLNKKREYLTGECGLEWAQEENIIVRTAKKRTI
ncbi:hypothetical protein MPSEU_000606500 [Mayamaea pseudoterrestris]|nr:hypothetical protein MPSEU_000606000 [Mayamaea pseudoterrestris]GKY96470.1 hypothetical protein MPSEU_000606500 [Mayamaea pseudoterrestris]